MASTFSTLLAIEIMATGEQESTWGDKTSDNLKKLENTIAGTLDIALAASDFTLTTVNGGNGSGSTNPANMVLDCTGTLSANVDIIAPNLSKIYIVRNATSGGFTVSMKTPTGTNPLVIPQGETHVVFCDPSADSAKGEFYQINALVSGTVALATNALQLGGVVAANYAQKAVKNDWTKPQTVLGQDITLSAFAYTPIAANDGTMFISQGQLTQNITINNPTGTPAKGQIMTFQIEQHATTPVSITWDTKFVFTDDVAVDLTQTANVIDVFTAQYNANIDRWLVAGVAQNIPRS